MNGWNKGLRGHIVQKHSGQKYIAFCTKLELGFNIIEHTLLYFS